MKPYIGGATALLLVAMTTSTFAQSARSCWGACERQLTPSQTHVLYGNIARNVEDARNGMLSGGTVNNTVIGTNINVEADQECSGDCDIIVTGDNDGDTEGTIDIGTLTN